MTRAEQAVLRQARKVAQAYAAWMRVSGASLRRYTEGLTRYQDAVQTLAAAAIRLGAGEQGGRARKAPGGRKR